MTTASSSSVIWSENLPILLESKPAKWRFPQTWIVDATFDGNQDTSVGIDPGVNFGMAVITGSKVRIMYGKLPRRTEKGLHGVDAYDNTSFFFQGDPLWEGVPSIVEGAAYRSQFGQVGLEEVRFGFFLALYHCGLDVHILPPATVRKMAFGNGNQQAGDLWPKLNHNGADALGMALAALEMKHE